MATNIFGNRLRQARKAAGLSLRALAHLVGLSHNAIQKYEKGEVFPSSEYLIKIAKAIHIPIEHLFRSQTVELGPLKFRKRAGLLVKARRKIEYQIRDKLERRLELENCYPKSPIKIFDSSWFPSIEVNNYEDIEKVVVKIRNKWKLGLAPIHNFIDVLENNGIRVIEVETDENSFDALFFLVSGKPVVAISNKWSGDRQRFSLAHELGHFFCSLSPLPDNLKEEKICNQFAGAFLFPKQAVYQKFGEHRTSIELRELLLSKQEYGLSMYAILYRLFQLKVIGEFLFKRWQILIKTKGWHKQEPGVQLPPEKAYTFEQMIFHALGEEYISEAKAAELLNVTIYSFRNLRMNNGCTSSNN
jgi:Zn-dependent peptidase ImmA (M78 family)/DNA-binding XRE family transcriptional regulator